MLHAPFRPGQAARDAGKKRVEQIRKRNDQFPTAYLELLNAPWMRGETSDQLGEELTFWKSRRLAHGSDKPRPLGKTILTRESPPDYLLSPAAAHKTWQLVERLNTLPGVSFALPPSRSRASVNVLLIHYVGALLRRYADAVIAVKAQHTAARRQLFEIILSALYQKERQVRPREHEAQESSSVTIDRWMAVENCGQARRLLHAFSELKPELLAQLRKCKNPRCAGPGPYFLQRSIADQKFCHHHCQSLARTLSQ